MPSPADDPSSPASVDAELSAVLRDQASSRQDELTELMQTARRLTSTLTLSLSSQARARVRSQLVDANSRAMELLLGWQDLGGQVALQVPSTVEPELEPDRADAPMLLLPSPLDPPAADAEPQLDAAIETEPDIESETEPSTDVEPQDDVEPEPEPKPASTAAPSPSRPAPPPSQPQLQALQSHFERGPTTPPLVREGWHTHVDHVLAGLVPSSDLDEEEDRVCSAAFECGTWTVFPKSVQRLLVGLVTCRLRSLQDEHGRQGTAMNSAFSRLTAFSSSEQPGFVFGLARTHRPQHGSWTEDADRYWDELADLLPSDDEQSPSVGELLRDIEALVPEIDQAPEEARPVVQRQVVRKIRAALEGGVRARHTRLVNLAAPLLDHLEGREFRSLRRAIRDQAAPDTDSDTTDDDGPLPTDWAWWSCTRGRRALLVGGDPREPNRRRLQEIFGFQSLEWEATTGKPQSLQSLATRIRKGSIDLLIILTRFVGHNYDDILLPACKEADVDWVSVDHGYGAARIRLAIERFLEVGG